VKKAGRSATSRTNDSIISPSFRSGVAFERSIAETLASARASVWVAIWKSSCSLFST